AGVEIMAPWRESRLEGKQRVVLCGSPASQMEDAIAALLGPSPNVVEKDLQGREPLQFVVASREMGVHETLVFDEDHRSRHLVLESGHHQPQMCSQCFSQTPEVISGEEVLRRGIIATHRPVVWMDEAGRSR